LQIVCFAHCCDSGVDTAAINPLFAKFPFFLLLSPHFLYARHIIYLYLMALIFESMTQ
jgi:hypothetical protein